jgi:hypothetical protein
MCRWLLLEDYRSAYPAFAVRLLGSGLLGKIFSCKPVVKSVQTGPSRCFPEDADV